MQAARGSGWIVLSAIAAAMALAACGGAGRLSPDAPQTVNLAGVWKLNRAASDDPIKVVELLRPKYEKRLAESDDDASYFRRRSTDPAPLVDSDPGVTDPRARFSMMERVLLAGVSQSDTLTIGQNPTEFVLDDGTGERRFTPGVVSVVSVPMGVADQRSGWRGKQYVIEVRPQAGPNSIERYGLSADGKQLSVDIEVGGNNNLPRVEIKRLYDAANSMHSTVPASD